MKASRICAVVPAAVVLVAGTALAGGPPAPISECDTVITEPGKYKVTQDLYCAPEQQGIIVLASAVSIDLKGHTITCDASGAGLVGAVLIGDYQDPSRVVKNVHVKNGTVAGCNDGVIFFFTRSGKVSKMSLVGNSSGITLVEAEKTLVMKNNAASNDIGISSYGGVGNQIKHNDVRGHYDSGILVDEETDSVIACNTSEWDAFGIAVGPFSTGNKVRGNLVSNAAFSGLTAYGWGTDKEVYAPVPSGNRIRHNIVTGSAFSDLTEALFHPATYEPIVFEGAQCQNTWRRNKFVSQFGPIDCIGAPVVLDDICAIDDDDRNDK
jgi:parallel beta-helix repeat protein